MIKLKKIHKYLEENNSNEQLKEDIFSNINYICQSSTLITKGLKENCDVAQLGNGDIIVTQIKTVIYRYIWDENKGKLIRSRDENRLKKYKSQGS